MNLSPNAEKLKQLQEKIDEIHAKNKGTYSSKSLTRLMKASRFSARLSRMIHLIESHLETDEEAFNKAWDKEEL